MNIIYIYIYFIVFIFVTTLSYNKTWISLYFRLQRFEKTNEMLTNCNQLSINRLKSAGAEFKKHTALLIEMKKDLDYIFKRIRIVKNKLSQQYPQAFNGKLNMKNVII